MKNTGSALIVTLFFCVLYPLNAQISTVTNDSLITADENITLPRFSGGNEALLLHIQSSLIYPETAFDNQIEGRTVCGFTISELGKVINPKVLKSSGNSLFDNEALRLVNSIPDWEPATKNGKPYSVDQTVPVTFNYSKEKNRIFLEDILTTKPEFPGGKNKYHEFLSKNVRYPINALERGTGDFLIISFIIENDGTISNIEPYTESIAMFSRAIEKVLKASPKWNPGKINNRSVRTQMFLPVLFTTDEKIDASQYPENTFYIRAFSTIKSIRIF